MKAAHDIMNEYINLGRAWRSREGTVADEFSDLVTAEVSSCELLLTAEDLENWKRKLGTGIWNMES